MISIEVMVDLKDTTFVIFIQVIGYNLDHPMGSRSRKCKQFCMHVLVT